MSELNIFTEFFQYLPPEYLFPSFVLIMFFGFVIIVYRNQYKKEKELRDRLSEYGNLCMNEIKNNLNELNVTINTLESQFVTLDQHVRNTLEQHSKLEDINNKRTLDYLKNIEEIVRYNKTEIEKIEAQRHDKLI